MKKTMDAASPETPGRNVLVQMLQLARHETASGRPPRRDHPERTGEPGVAAHLASIKSRKKIGSQLPVQVPARVWQGSCPGVETAAVRARKGAKETLQGIRNVSVRAEGTKGEKVYSQGGK